MPALEQFLGSAAGLSAATVTRLTTQWQDDAAVFHRRSLRDVDYVNLWVDGIHLKVRLEQDKVCLLVMIGVRADGRKELVGSGRRIPREHRVLGGSAAQLQTSRHAGTGAGRRRRGAGLLRRRCATYSPPPVSSAGRFHVTRMNSAT